MNRAAIAFASLAFRAWMIRVVGSDGRLLELPPKRLDRLRAELEEAGPKGPTRWWMGARETRTHPGHSLNTLFPHSVRHTRQVLPSPNDPDTSRSHFGHISMAPFSGGEERARERLRTELLGRPGLGSTHRAPLAPARVADHGRVSGEPRQHPEGFKQGEKDILRLEGTRAASFEQRARTLGFATEERAFGAQRLLIEEALNG